MRLPRFYCFYPEPKVDSAVVKLTPKSLPSEIDLKLLKKVCQTAFNQRRKKIRTSLKLFLIEDDFANLSINSGLRAEDLSVKQYHQLS